MLTETWTDVKTDITFQGYTKVFHSFRKQQHRRAKRASGGILIYVKDSVSKGITMVKNDVDYIIWVKLDKTFFGLENDVFICVTYIAPENSQVYTTYNIHAYDQLADDIMFFQEKGIVFVT